MSFWKTCDQHKQHKRNGTGVQTLLNIDLNSSWLEMCCEFLNNDQKFSSFFTSLSMSFTDMECSVCAVCALNHSISPKIIITYNIRYPKITQKLSDVWPMFSCPLQVCLLLLASLALMRADSQQLNPNVNEIDDKIPEKPEPRQIGANIGAVMPYAWLQPAQVAAPSISNSWGLASPSWWSSLGNGQSLMSLFRPNSIGGRRSSLSNRLRNLMNALFYRWALNTVSF